MSHLCLKILNAPNYLRTQIQNSQHDIQGPHHLASPLSPVIFPIPLCLTVTQLLTIPHIDLVSTLRVFTHHVSNPEMSSPLPHTDCSHFTWLTPLRFSSGNCYLHEVFPNFFVPGLGFSSLVP